MSICLIFRLLRILMATLWPVRMCSATFTCSPQVDSMSAWGHTGWAPDRAGKSLILLQEVVRRRGAHLAKAADAQGLAQPVVGQEELRRLIDILHAVLVRRMGA